MQVINFQTKFICNICPVPEPMQWWGSTVGLGWGGGGVLCVGVAGALLWGEAPASGDCAPLAALICFFNSCETTDFVSRSRSVDGMG